MTDVTPYVLQCVWPIVDETYTRSELIAEATPQLAQLADQHDATPAGPPVWQLAPAEDVVGWGDYAPGAVLIGRLPVIRGSDFESWKSACHVDPVKVERALTVDTTTAHELGIAERIEAVRIAAVNYRLSDTQIANRLRMASRSVVRIRSRHDIPTAFPTLTRKEAA